MPSFQVGDVVKTHTGFAEFRIAEVRGGGIASILVRVAPWRSMLGGWSDPFSDWYDANTFVLVRREKPKLQRNLPSWF